MLLKSTIIVVILTDKDSPEHHATVPTVPGMCTGVLSFFHTYFTQTLTPINAPNNNRK